MRGKNTTRTVPRRWRSILPEIRSRRTTSAVFGYRSKEPDRKKKDVSLLRTGESPVDVDISAFDTAVIHAEEAALGAH